MKDGWYSIVGTKFQDHFFRKSSTESKSRCGKIFNCELKLLNGNSKNNQCTSCQNLLRHDDYKDRLVEPHRY